jgi:hypothetical protein
MKSIQSEGRITKITFIGAPTALIGSGSLRLLTDPTFDLTGADYKLTKKLIGPALSPSQKLESRFYDFSTARLFHSPSPRHFFMLCSVHSAL